MSQFVGRRVLRTVVSASLVLLALQASTKQASAQSMMWEPSSSEDAASSTMKQAPAATTTATPATTGARPEPTTAPLPAERVGEPAKNELVRGGYAGAGALYLPIDEGLTAAAVYGGFALKASDSIDMGFGARLGYGESRYSSAVVFTPEVHIYRWWGHYGLGVTTGIGIIGASKKGTSGWDGALAGIMMTGSPVRLRFGMIEPSLDVGVLYAVGQSYPAPFIMPTLTARF